MKTLKLFTILSLLLIATTCFGFQGKVVKVTDGDTITVLSSDNAQTSVRLYGIDAPESKQAFGTRSKQYLSSLVFGETVSVVDLGKDFYGRTIGKVYLGDRYINLMIVEAGLAWHYKQYSAKDAEFTNAENKARKDAIGLWSGKNPVPPWQFRADKKARK